MPEEMQATAGDDEDLSTMREAAFLRAAVALQDIQESLKASDVRAGIEQALTREMVRIEHRLGEAAKTAMLRPVGEARLQMHLGVLEATERLALVEPFLRHVLGRAKRAAHRTDIKDFAAPAKLHLTLARMELDDILAARRARAHEELKNIERATERALDELIARIDHITAELRAR